MSQNDRMKRLLPFIAVAALSLFCTGAAKPFDWGLPPGVSAPPVPLGNPMSPVKVELGRRLFYDPRMSEDGAVSCASCHQQEHAFADPSRTKPGVHGSPGRRNPMGLANVDYILPLTWADPSMRSLEAQVATPLFGDRPIEMGMPVDGALLAARLSGDACYRRLFAAAFPESSGAISAASIAKALAAFQRTLLSFDAPYDREHRGEAGAMSDRARVGETRFDALGCTQCHNGPNLTDGKYHQVVGPLGDDPGVFEKTAEAHQRGFFRTPSLRNVALTAPYLRDGRADTLRQAIAAHPADLQIGEDDLRALEGFLASLTDERFLKNPSFGPPARGCDVVGD